MSARVRRRALQDLYVEGDAAAVMVDSVVVVLSPLATALLERVDEDWVPLDAVVAHLVDRFGAPEGTSARDATLAVLTELAEQHVLDVDDAPAPGAASGSMGT